MAAAAHDGGNEEAATVLTLGGDMQVTMNVRGQGPSDRVEGTTNTRRPFGPLLLLLILPPLLSECLRLDGGLCCLQGSTTMPLASICGLRRPLLLRLVSTHPHHHVALIEHCVSSRR